MISNKTNALIWKQKNQKTPERMTIHYLKCTENFVCHMDISVYTTK